MDLISKQTRLAFREHLVGWTLRTISDLFDAADIPRMEVAENQLPSGQRRSLVEQYYAGVDWSSPQDVRKVLRVYEDILAELDPHSKDYQRLANLLRRDNLVHKDGRLISPGFIDVAKVERASEKLSLSALRDHVRRIEQSVESDPAQAIGSAKELVETVAKLVLRHYSRDPEQYTTLPKLVKEAMKCLDLSVDGTSSNGRGAASVKQVLAGLSQVTGGISELRNFYGTGHGRDEPVWVDPRCARLVAGAAATICVFLLETLDAQRRSGL